jgi:hypothetical protein
MMPVTNWLISPPSALQYTGNDCYATCYFQAPSLGPRASNGNCFTGCLSKKSFYRVPLEIVAHAHSISLSGCPPSNSGSTVFINDTILSLISSLWPRNCKPITMCCKPQNPSRFAPTCVQVDDATALHTRFTSFILSRKNVSTQCEIVNGH